MVGSLVELLVGATSAALVDLKYDGKVVTNSMAGLVHPQGKLYDNWLLLPSSWCRQVHFSLPVAKL